MRGRPPASGNPASAARLGWNALFVLTVPGIVGVALPLALHALSPSILCFEWASGGLVGAGLGAAGLAFYAAGMREQMRAGQSPSPLVASNSLVTTGVYGQSRNPMYVAGTMYFAGLALALQSWTLVIYALVVAFLYYPLLIRSEERVLNARFGAAFQDYCARTPRWLRAPWAPKR